MDFFFHPLSNTDSASDITVTAANIKSNIAFVMMKQLIKRVSSPNENLMG